MAGYSELCESVDKVVEVLEPFLPLVNCHMVDFLSCNLWDKYIPEDIREEVNALGPDKVLDIFLCKSQEKDSSGSPTQQFLNRANCVSSLNIISTGELWSSLEKLGGKVSETIPQLSMFMSPKKAYEVEVFSKVIASVSQISDTGCIIDLGGGKGYLGSTLVYHYGLHVLSIDCAQVNTHGAAKLANNLMKWWKSTEQKTCLSSNICSGRYRQVTTFVSPETNLNNIILEEFKSDVDTVSNLDKLCLVGLHACGDLSPSCIRLFCRNPNIRALCIVGCCYNLMTDNSEESLPGGSQECSFPLSQYLRKKGVKLDRNARMLAAQSRDRILQEGKPLPKSLWFRSLLQVLLMERGENTDVQVGRSKAQIQEFSQYLSEALMKLKLPQASLEEAQGIQSRYHSRQRLHDIFFMMRVMMAPLIESIILLDRLLYLREQEIENSRLVQLFDSVISPRCCGIIAFKDKLE